MGQRWPSNYGVSKFAQNSPESDIYIKQMFNPQYLGNVGDKKWSPYFDSEVLLLANFYLLKLIGPEPSKWHELIYGSIMHF